MNNQEWREWRHKHIGGSDAPIIMGVSKYKTPLQLYEEKILPKPPEEKTNFIQQRGHQFEPKIRDIFNVAFEKNMQVALCESADFPFLSVSLDGRDGDEICEIKLASKEDHEITKSGKMPEHYYPQIQHELLVSGAKKCWYISYWDQDQDMRDIDIKHMATLEVFPDENYIKEMIEQESAFWNHVQKRKPVAPSPKDYKMLKGLSKQANKYKRLKLKMDTLENEIEAIKSELIEAARSSGHPRLEISGVQLLQVEREGNVDYKSIPELRGIDLDKYRKKGSTYWKVTV